MANNRLKPRDARDENTSPEEEKESTASGQTVEKPERTPASMKKQERSVLIYTTVLFVVALALILIAYFIQQRTTDNLTEITAQHGQFSSQALQNIEELQKKNQELSDALAEAEDRQRELSEQLEDAMRTLEEQAAELAILSQSVDAADKRAEQSELDLEEQRRKTEAMALLAALLSAPEGSDVTEIVEQLESLREYLDGAYLSIYNSHVGNK